MKVADDQLFKRENCTKREELNALRSVIPSMRLDTGKESNPAETFPKHEDSREEGTSVVTLSFQGTVTRTWSKPHVCLLIKLISVSRYRV